MLLSSPQEEEPSTNATTEKHNDAEDKAPVLWMRHWFESKRGGSILMKWQVKNREKKVKLRLAIELVDGENIKGLYLL